VNIPFGLSISVAFAGLDFSHCQYRRFYGSRVYCDIANAAIEPPSEWAKSAREGGFLMAG